jgi:hypothetical protein
MRKLLALIVAASSIGFAAVFGEAKTPDPSAAATTADKPQVRIQIGNRNRNRNWNQNRNRNRFRNRNRGIRRTTMIRIIWVGRQRYREVIEITYLPNGRTMTRVISRVRVR